MQKSPTKRFHLLNSKVSDNDELPKTLCTECCDKIEMVCLIKVH